MVTQGVTQNDIDVLALLYLLKEAYAKKLEGLGFPISSISRSLRKLSKMNIVDEPTLDYDGRRLKKVYCTPHPSKVFSQIEKFYENKSKEAFKEFIEKILQILEMMYIAKDFKAIKNLTTTKFNMTAFSPSFILYLSLKGYVTVDHADLSFKPTSKLVKILKDIASKRTEFYKEISEMM